MKTEKGKDLKVMNCEVTEVRRTQRLSVHAIGRKDQSCKLITYEGPVQSTIRGTEKWS